MEIILNFNIHFGYFAVAKMREIAQSFEDGGMPGTIGRCYWWESAFNIALQCMTFFISLPWRWVSVG